MPYYFKYIHRAAGSQKRLIKIRPGEVLATQSNPISFALAPARTSIPCTIRGRGGLEGFYYKFITKRAGIV